MAAERTTILDWIAAVAAEVVIDQDDADHIAGRIAVAEALDAGAFAAEAHDRAARGRAGNPDPRHAGGKTETGDAASRPARRGLAVRCQHQAGLGDLYRAWPAFKGACARPGDGGGSAQQLRGQAIATDRGVDRDRPLVLPHEGEATTERMQGRAVWRAKRAAGNAATAEITVMGWRDAGGEIWAPNHLVHVQNEWIGINGTMLIKSVTLEQEGDDGDGTTATLSLADPRGYGGENPRGDSADAYAAPGNISAEWEQE